MNVQTKKGHDACDTDLIRIHWDEATPCGIYWSVIRPQGPSPRKIGSFRPSAPLIWASVVEGTLTFDLGSVETMNTKCQSALRGRDYCEKQERIPFFIVMV